ncbi:hypothetical protein CHS0354_021386 [Potamilus streckersoni]|uniref:C1q domain-containing protein n=1 Tax=Potamilus streckersoni TaxID=2493646 RepID=A0AAE0VMS5_9BIVA|nr:hypothetical protein CHS0354_021386 [Potamilus streckersoni]
MEWHLIFSSLIYSSVFLYVQSYPVLSKSESNDSLDRVVNALHKRLAILEVAVSSNNVNDELNDLRRELQDVKQENERLIQRVLRHEENLEQLRRDNHELCFHKLSSHSIRLTDQKMIKPLTPHNIKENVSGERNTRDNSRAAMRETGNREFSALSSGAQPRSKKNDLKVRRNLFERQVQENHVAFHAQVSVPDLVNLGIHQTIVFDKIVTNIGGGYHHSTGIFIAPISGVYVFHVTAMSTPGKNQFLMLTKDGAGIQLLYTEAITNYESASITVPLELGKGSEVWVQTETGMGTIHGYTQTIFTGFLLYPM